MALPVQFFSLVLGMWVGPRRGVRPFRVFQGVPYADGADERPVRSRRGTETAPDRVESNLFMVDRNLLREFDISDEEMADAAVMDGEFDAMARALEGGQ